jgi:DNA gyrase inhibitor GyrI
MKRKKLMIFSSLFAVIIVAFVAWGYVSSQVEQAKYTVISTHDDIEIRDYPPTIVAEVETTGQREEAIKAGFRLLADYIFGNNKSQSKVAMTAPVTQQHSEDIPVTAPVTQESVNGQWQVRFMMPSTYDLASLPQPNNDKVHLKEIPEKRFVVIRFSGRPTETTLKEKQEKLQGFVQAQKNETLSGPTYAFFNPPWTLPPLRRNEIMIEIQKPAP